LKARAPRVLIAEFSDRLLTEIVSDALTRQLSAQVQTLPARGGRSELEAAAERGRPDVVVLELDRMELPAICDRLLATLPEAVVLGVACGEGSRACVRIAQHALHADALGPDRLAAIVSAAIQGSNEKGL